MKLFLRSLLLFLLVVAAPISLVRANIGVLDCPSNTVALNLNPAANSPYVLFQGNLPTRLDFTFVALRSDGVAMTAEDASSVRFRSLSDAQQQLTVKCEGVEPFTLQGDPCDSATVSRFRGFSWWPALDPATFGNPVTIEFTPHSAAGCTAGSAGQTQSVKVLVADASLAESSTCVARCPDLLTQSAGVVVSSSQVTRTALATLVGASSSVLQQLGCPITVPPYLTVRVPVTASVASLPRCLPAQQNACSSIIVGITPAPSPVPTGQPSASPSPPPTSAPSPPPTSAPSPATEAPSPPPSAAPSPPVTGAPSPALTTAPSAPPSVFPSAVPGSPTPAPVNEAPSDPPSYFASPTPEPSPLGALTPAPSPQLPSPAPTAADTVGPNQFDGDPPPPGDQLPVVAMIVTGALLLLLCVSVLALVIRRRGNRGARSSPDSSRLSSERASGARSRSASHTSQTGRSRSGSHSRSPTGVRRSKSGRSSMRRAGGGGGSSASGAFAVPLDNDFSMVPSSANRSYAPTSSEFGRLNQQYAPVSSALSASASGTQRTQNQYAAASSRFGGAPPDSSYARAPSQMGPSVGSFASINSSPSQYIPASAALDPGDAKSLYAKLPTFGDDGTNQVVYSTLAASPERAAVVYSPLADLSSGVIPGDPKRLSEYANVPSNIQLSSKR